MDHLTKNQSLGLLGFTAVLLAVNAVAGRVIVKNHDEIKEKYDKLTEVGNELGRITSYQSQLIRKHIDLSLLDDFDRMVINDMTEDFNKLMHEFRALVEEKPPKPDTE